MANNATYTLLKQDTQVKIESNSKTSEFEAPPNTLDEVKVNPNTIFNKESILSNNKSPVESSSTSLNKCTNIKAELLEDFIIKKEELHSILSNEPEQRENSIPVDITDTVVNNIVENKEICGYTTLSREINIGDFKNAYKTEETNENSLADCKIETLDDFIIKKEELPDILSDISEQATQGPNELAGCEKEMLKDFIIKNEELSDILFDKSEKTTERTLEVERPKFRCSQCDYTTHAQYHARRHILKHKKFNCEECSFETVWKHRFDQHVLRYKSEVELDKHTLKCDKLGAHLRRHKTKPEKVVSIKCDHCKFKTKYQSRYKKHLLQHINPEPVEILSCDQCEYKTPRKHILKRHMLRHETPKQTFKCYNCPYQSVRKNKLVAHVLIHQNRERINLFKCEHCTYSGIRKQDLKRHQQHKHMTINNMEAFQCTQCEFRHMNKDTMNKHILIHKSKDEVETYQCSQCDYNTKRKGDLNKHIILHDAEYNPHACTKCDFRTNNKRKLKNHVMVHAYPETAQVYDCELCEYKTIRRGDMSRHVKGHKDKSRVARFKNRR